MINDAIKIVMNRNKLKTALMQREILFGGWISYDHPAIAETFAMTNFDFIAIDMEHAPISLSSAQRIISISQGYQIPCLPRPVSHSNDFIKPLLDSGSDGLIMQMVENYDEVTRISSLMKYPPMGKRTFGVNRAQSFGLNFEDYVKNWNQESILIVQIESKEGVNNIESITSHPAIDGVMIGPYDLSGSYGVPGETNHPIIIEASKKIINACKKNKKSCGTQIANPDKLSTQEALDLGYNFLIMGSDLFLITYWSRQVSKLINNIKNG